MIKKIACIFVIICTAFVFCSCSNASEKYDSWHLNSMKIDKLWKYSTGESQTIAFIDTGISDTLLETYGDRVVFKYNVIDNSEDVTDFHGHGTEMVSVACGDGSNKVWGIAKNSKIIIIKAVSNDGKTDNNKLLEALNYAVDNNATIINISLGGSKESSDVTAKINDAISKGITVVSAGGDYGNKDLLFPANQDGVISVEARTNDNKIWEMSNTSKDSIVAFPGVDILAISLVDGVIDVQKATGTSQATSIASGYIALLKDYALNNSAKLDNKKLIEVLKKLNSKTEGKNINYLLPFKLVK